MYRLKGFITHAALVDNTVGVTAALGELSTESLTYARDKGQYVLAAATNLTLTTFLTQKDGVNVPATDAVSTGVSVSDHVLTVANWVYQQTILNGQPTGQTMVGATLLEELLVAFAGVASNFECGNIITSGQFMMPEWLSWSISSLSDATVKIWFSDDSFQRQYDEYELVVIPPTTALDNFFARGSDVAAMLNSLTISMTMNAVQTAKAGYPETVMRADQYNYYDPQNANNIVPSDWVVLIYGIAGNNDDVVKQALVDYILANSTHPQSDWMGILPDIFKRTEFILIPQWGNYAIPNRTVQAGIYSPISNLTSALTLIGQTVPGYPSAHINSHATVMGHPYKSLNVFAIGGPDNRNNMFELTAVFPDYLDIASTSIDFNRISANTQSWMLLIAQMITIAETMDAYSDIPVSMTRTTRDGILYLVLNFQSIHYMVAAKVNFTTGSSGQTAVNSAGSGSTGTSSTDGGLVDTTVAATVTSSTGSSGTTTTSTGG